jgi:hypothetical protein
MNDLLHVAGGIHIDVDIGVVHDDDGNTTKGT